MVALRLHGSAYAGMVAARRSLGVGVGAERRARKVQMGS